MRNSFWKLSKLMILIMPFSTVVTATENKSIEETKQIEYKINHIVENVLSNAENALEQVNSNPSKSLFHVEDAIASVLKIREQYSEDVHAKDKSPLIVGQAKEYWFVYPSVNNDVLSNKDKFPTIYSKFESGVLYQGQNDLGNENPNAYFDYAFAHASLITAREALVAKNTREAISSLKWVFEAIYISPDFYVAEANNSQRMDQLLNLNGQYPLVSSKTLN